MQEMTQIISQTILVRDLQKQYFILRKGNGRYPSAESRVLLKESKEQEIKLDCMLTEYIKAYDGLMIIENITEKPLNPTHHENPN